MKPIIPKTPSCPQLSSDEIKFLTSVTFEKAVAPKPCDLLFVFAGTHPGHWERAIEAYQKGYAKQILVTGGRSLTGTAHKDWDEESESEAAVICQHLFSAGIPKEKVISEHHSTNTLENVLFAKKIFDFNTISSIMFICKSHATGRQRRTLAKYLPSAMTYVPFTFDAVYKGEKLSRE